MTPLHSHKVVQQPSTVVHEHELHQYLREAIYFEMFAAFQYWVAYNTVEGGARLDLASEFKEHIEDELKHIEKLSKRLRQLGCKPDRSMMKVTQTVGKSIVFNSDEPLEMLRAILEAENAGIHRYNKIAELTVDTDPVTYNLVSDILTKGAEHTYEIEQLHKALANS